ncbi:MAG: hypothetical protein D6801_01875 [Alphaproteobacteria bacterium]|nr:MAG: hypothetical protein D6801_01875 [Alphaproteobacteria bacterium]
MVVTRWGARFLGRRFPCAIGRGGITPAKREGDGATPAGAHRLVLGAWRADRRTPPATALPLLAVGPHDIWSDDPRDPAYNHWQTRTETPYSHERLRRGDRLYDLFFVTDWNWPDATPGQGSAIFVHLWRRPRFPTAGCIAFRARDLDWIAARWTGRSRLIVRA